LYFKYSSFITIAYLKKYRFAKLPDEGELEWLIKNLNPAYQQLMMEKLEETLYKLSFHINSQEEISSNVSSLALRVRMINLEMKTKLNNKALENIIIKRLYFLFYYLKVVKDIDYNYRNVSVKFNSVIPSDDLMVSQIISQMGEKLSLKTALKNFSWVENVDAEIKEIKSEQSELVQGQSLLNNANGDSNGQ
jgi:SPP1 family phage portal protein